MKTIDEIEQEELTVGEREILADDRKRWKHMGTGAHLDEWLSFAPGLMIRRRLAMRLAFTNRPEGRGYVSAFSQLMKRDGLDTMDKTSMTAVLWLNEDAERMNTLREIREAMTPGERSRLNSPISARQRVEKLLKARAGGTEAEMKMKTSPLAVAKKMIADRDREIASMKSHIDELEAADRDGSLFDLKRDNAEDIGRVIASNVGQTKAKRIAETILTTLKAAKPAG
jgi:hypothetical protein